MTPLPRSQTSSRRTRILVGREPVLKKPRIAARPSKATIPSATYPRRVGPIEDHDGLEISSATSLIGAAPKRDQVRRRGLLAMKRGWFVSWVWGGHHGQRVRRGVGAELISLSRPLMG